MTEDEAELIRLLLRHPKARTILGRLVEYNEDPEFMLAYLASPGSGSPDKLPAIIPGLDETDGDISGWFDAMIEASEERLAKAGATPAVQASLAQLAIGRMLRLGLNPEAVERYFRYPESVRRTLPIIPWTSEADRRGCERRESGFRFADDLAAALWLEGHGAEARQILERSKGERAEPDSVVALRREALLEGMTAVRADAGLFDRLFAPMASGRRKDELRQCIFPSPGGWYDALNSSSPGLVEIVARRLAAAGHHDVAAGLRSPRLSEPTRSDDLGRLSFLFPGDIGARQRRWAEAIQEAQRKRRADDPAAAPRPLRVHLAPLEPWWIERPLPATTRPARKGAPALPKGLDLPVAGESVLRHEVSGGEQALLYRSGEYDLPGEVPAHGLWFVRTQGGKWARPLYLGLQEHFPYQVARGSNLKLLDGDTLRIEVSAREIDSASISFPPVGLVVRTKRDGLFLEMDLARIAADRDSDGLTDIEERRLGLDFNAADTDKDGLSDSADPAPLSSAADVRDEIRNAVATAVVARIFGHDSGGIGVGLPEPGKEDDPGRVLGQGSAAPDARRSTVFLIAPGDLFNGFADPKIRLFLYSRAEAEAVRSGPAPFYVPEILSHFQSLDGQTHYISWSARWVGGAFMVRCRKGAAACQIEDRQSWIT